MAIPPGTPLADSPAAAAGRSDNDKEHAMGTILLIILILLLIGAFPSWPYSRGWGYYPSGLLGIVVIVLIVMLLTGRL